MAVPEDLPEEIILNIFSRLPVKSLIRFTSVSKRLHFIILSDPKFALCQHKAARQQKTLNRRLLVATDNPELQSLPLDDTPSFEDPSSVRNITPPILQGRFGSLTNEILGSCNGLVFLCVRHKFYYVWNPSTGFVKKLPDPGFPYLAFRSLGFSGVGYLSATDDYKVLVAYDDYTEPKRELDENLSFIVEMFSSKTQTWERIASSCGSGVVLLCPGALLNDTFHWLNLRDDEHGLVCFDLVGKEFRRMRPPNFDDDGKSTSRLVVFGGCLCVSRYPKFVCDSIDFWVMREYGVSDSWTMLFSLKVPDPPPVWPERWRKLLVAESSTVLVATNLTAAGYSLTRIDHKEDQKLGWFILNGLLMFMVEYEESLLWISDYQPVKETEQVEILETHHKASQS